LAQTLKAVEVVVVDDGSADPPEIPDDERVRCIRLEQRRGVCAARNAAVDAAVGQWILFLDDDDQLTPNMLERSLEAAARSDLPRPVAILSGIEIVDMDGRRLELRLPPTLPKGCGYFLEGSLDGLSYQTQNSLVAPLSVVREIGGWDEQLFAMVHDDFFLRLNAVVSIQGLSDVGYRLTAHPGPRVSRDLAARADAMTHTLVAHRNVFRRYTRSYADYLGRMGITQLRAGRWRPAIAATSRSLVLDVRRPKALRQWAVSLAGPRAWRSIDRVRSRRARTDPNSGVARGHH
jgi:glycosyltransferase involved in cell wall biosynthesis